MIFVTIGTQLPFERLIKTVDQWAADHPKVEVFAQIGVTEYKPENIEYVTRLAPKAYDEKCQQASVIVGHVGMGTIITGISASRPLVLMPRLSSLGEHRNDHQVSTAKHFDSLSLVNIVNNLTEFDQAVSSILAADRIDSENSLQVSDQLISAISDYIK